MSGILQAHRLPCGRVTFLCVATAPQERREQRSWPAGRRAGARSKEKWPKERPPQSDALRAFGNCSCVALPPASMQASCPPSSRSDSGVCRQSILGLTPNWAQSIAPTLRAFLRHFAAAQGARSLRIRQLLLRCSTSGIHTLACAAKKKRPSGSVRVAVEFPSPALREKVPGGRMRGF